MFAAIDLGTNACRLLIAVREGASMRVIGSYSTTVRLGEGLARDGAFAEDALERTITALKVCAQQMARYGVTRTRAIATEACRRAVNADAFLARAKAETGIALEVVPAAEEARLAAAGCADLIGAGYEGALVFDIGGGSTELIVARRTQSVEVQAWCSVPIGVSTLAGQHGGRNLPPATFAPMRDEMYAAIGNARECLGAFDPSRFHLLGTSGTLTTLMGAHLGLPRYDRRRIDGQWLERAEAEALIARVAGADFATRAAIPCIGDDRADFILPGCAILAAIMAHFPCARLRVADRGLREGLLAQMMAGE